MNLKEYVGKLQGLISDKPELGDLTVIYSSDEEGNDFHKVSRTGDLCYVEDTDGYYLEDVYWEDDLKHDEEMLGVKPNCVCIN